MLITVHKTNTGHWTVGLYNESNAQNKFAFKCCSCHAFNVVHQLSSFCAPCFAIFADEDVLLIFVLQTFSWNHSPIYFVCSPLSSHETFSKHLTLCCKNNTARHSGVASPKIRGGGRNSFGGAKMFDFRRITLFYLEKRLSRHKIIIFSKNLVGAMAHLPSTPRLRLWLDMGLNLRYSLVLLTQTSNFPYSLKNMSPEWKYFRWRILHFH